LLALVPLLHVITLWGDVDLSCAAFVSGVLLGEALLCHEIMLVFFLLCADKKNGFNSVVLVD